MLSNLNVKSLQEMKRRRKTPKHTSHIKAHPPHPPPILHVWSELATAKSSQPVSSSQHQLAPISRRGKAKVLNTAFRALQDWPHFISDLLSHCTPPCHLWSHTGLLAQTRFAPASGPLHKLFPLSIVLSPTPVLCIACFLTSFNPCSNTIFSVRPFLTSSFPFMSLPLLPIPLPFNEIAFQCRGCGFDPWLGN